MTFTIDDLSPEIDASLRARALAEQKSLERVIQDALRAYLVAKSASSPASEQADSTFSGVIGTWQEDPETEAILEEQRQIDPEVEPATYRDLSDIVNGPPLELEVVQAIEDLRSIEGEDWG